MLYALRTCDVFAGEDDFPGRVEAAHRGAFEVIVGGAISDAAWRHACLPLRLGGCGLGGVAELAPVARLAATLQFTRGVGPILGIDNEGVEDAMLTCPDLLGRLQRVLPVDLDPLVGWARTGRVVPELGPSGKQKW